MTKYEHSLSLLNEWRDRVKEYAHGYNGYFDTEWYRLPDDTFELHFYGLDGDPELKERIHNVCNIYMYAMKHWDEESEGDPVHDMDMPNEYHKAIVDKKAETLWLKEDTDWGEDSDDETDDDEEDWTTVYTSDDGWLCRSDVPVESDFGYNPQYLYAMTHRGICTGKVEDDAVNHPSHYTQGKFEVIDYIEDKLSDEEFFGYCIGNTLKYISRCRHKGNTLQDLKKADWYLNKLINKMDVMYNNLTNH